MGKRSQKVASVALCDSALGTDTRGAIHCAIALEDGKAPDWVMMFPATDVDGEIKCRDGRRFRLPNPEQLAAAYNGDSYRVGFDFDHKIELGGSEANGWVEELQVRDGAIWARVEWLPEGRAAIESKKYRYVSPAFNVDWDVGEIKSLTSAALTNRPAMKMPALSSVQKDTQMNPELLKLLGLDEKATPEQIAEATKKLQAKIEGETSELQAANARLQSELASARSAQPNLKDFVPRADYDATLARVVSLENTAKAAAERAHNEQVEAEIASALKAGKIVPATKDFYAKTCATADGLAAFRAFCASAPVIAPEGVVSGNPPAPTASSNLTALDYQVAAMCGISKEELEKSAKAAA